MKIKRTLSLVMIFVLLFSNVALALPSPSVPLLKSTTGKTTQNVTTNGQLKVTEPEGNQYKDTDKVRVIVELEGEPAITYATEQGVKFSQLPETTKEKLQSDILKEQEVVKSKLKSLSVNMDFKESFTTAFNGFSGEVKYGELTAISKVLGVKNVTVATEYKRPEVEPNMKYSKELVEAQLAWRDFGYDGEGMVVGIIDTGIDPSHRDMVLTDDSTAALTQEAVEAAAAENGLSGIYHTAKVPYGYNYMDQNQEILDLGPGASHHGMHVAGTVAANGDEANGGIKGVAPEAQLLALKVFGNDPNMASTWGDIYIKAIDDSIILGADVINMSLGSTASFVDENNPEQQAIARAVENGVLMSISAGNSDRLGSGWDNPYTSNPDIGVVGAPGLSYDSLQVASLENSFMDLDAFAYSFDGVEQGVYPFLSASSVHPNDLGSSTFEVVDAGLGAASDFEGKDFTGKVALIKRGTYTFVDKTLNAQAAGAAAAIIYNNTDGYVSMATSSEIAIPQLFMLKVDGESLTAQLDAGVQVAITFTGEKTTAPSPTAGQMSSFTSWGVTPNLDFKPEITAPGGNILSTLQDNQYGLMSGTSMAAPHVSGGSAIVLQRIDEEFDVVGKDRVTMAKNILLNTSQPVVDQGLYNDFYQTGNYYSPRRQGSGLMALHAALSTPVVVTEETTKEAKVALKEIKDNTATFTLKVENFSDEEVTYNVNGNVQTDLAYDGYNLTEAGGVFKPDTISDVAPYAGEYPISFSSNEVTVPAGDSATVDVSLDLTDAIDWMYNAPLEDIFENGYFVEGFVTLTDVNDVHPELTVPYVGFNGDWNAAPVLDGTIYGEANSFYGAAGAVDGEGYYLGYDPINNIYDSSNIAISPNGDGIKDEIVPVLSFLRNAKLVQYQVTDEQGNVVRKLRSETDVRKNYYDNGSSYPYSYNPANGWDGLANKSVVPDGTYNFEVATTIDYEGKEPQLFSLPVIVDTVAPTLDASLEGTTLNFTTTDEGSGVSFVDVLVDGETVLDEVPLSSDAGTFTIDSELPAGTTVTVVAYDNAGNKTEYKISGVNDSSIPMVSVNTPGTFTIHNTSEVTISGTVTDESEIVEFTVQGEKVELVWDEQAGVYTFETVATFEDGANPIEIVATDAAGNQHSLTNSRLIFVDTTAPEMTVDVPTTVNNQTESIDLNVVLSDNAEELRYYVDGNEEYYQALPGYDMVPFSTEFSTTVPLEVGENVFELELVDLAGNTTTETVTIVREDVSRLAGASRYETSVAVSQQGWENSDVVVLTRGDNYADALAGIPLAKKYDAPLLLTNTSQLTEVTKDEILRLGASKVYVLGGKGAVSGMTEDQLVDLGIEVIRIAGSDRYQTAALIASEVAPAGSTKAIVVNGQNFPDALSVASYAGANGLPILLAKANSVPDVTSVALSHLGVTETVAVGGTAVLSDEVIAELPGGERVSGENRYDTSVEVANYFAAGSSHYYVATGKSYADALSSAALAAKQGTGILLVGDSVGEATSTFVTENGVELLTIVGGVGAVSAEVFEALKGLLEN